MFEQEKKTNSERIINISNTCDNKQNSFNENYPCKKSMNNSISSQKLKTQNSTCSSYLKSNKTFSNEENLITDMKKVINESLLKNLYFSKFNINDYKNASNFKKFIYKKKPINCVTSFKSEYKSNNLNLVKNKKEKKIKKINLINDEFSKKIYNKTKKEFNDITLNEYLKEQIKHINEKNYNNNINNKENKENKETQNTQSFNINNINNRNNNKSKEKKLLNNYITYYNYKCIPNNQKIKQDKNKSSKSTINSKKSNIDLPKPKYNNIKGKILQINLNRKNSHFLSHRKYNSFDESMKNIFTGRNSQNLNSTNNHKIKIVNLQIDLNELINVNKDNKRKKKTFKFSKSSKKITEKININNFTKDFFILPKLKKF
jgi:hypothetical protein